MTIWQHLSRSRTSEEGNGGNIAAVAGPTSDRHRESSTDPTTIASNVGLFSNCVCLPTMCCCFFIIARVASGGSAQGGDGRHNNIHDGSHLGESVVLAGGQSDGKSRSDHGGSIKANAGERWRGDGGLFSISFGSSERRSSECYIPIHVAQMLNASNPQPFTCLCHFQYLMCQVEALQCQQKRQRNLVQYPLVRETQQ